MAPRQRPGRPAAARRAAPGPGRLGAPSAPSAARKSRHEEPWLAFLTGDNAESGRSRSWPPGRPRPAAGWTTCRPTAGHRRGRGRHPPVAAVQPGRHRSPRPASPKRPRPGDLQRRAAAGPGPLLRRHPAPPRPAPLGRRPGLRHRPAGDHRQPGQPRPRSRTAPSWCRQARSAEAHTIEAVRYTACPDRSWLGGLYDYGHGEPAVTEQRADVGGPWLTVRLPGSTGIRLTLTLALRTQAPSYATPFDQGRGGRHVMRIDAAPVASGSSPGGRRHGWTVPSWRPSAGTSPWPTSRRSPRRLGSTGRSWLRCSPVRRRRAEFLTLAGEPGLVAGVVGLKPASAHQNRGPGDARCPTLGSWRRPPGGYPPSGEERAGPALAGTGAEVRRGLRAVADAGLVYDLLTLPHQLPSAIDTVRALPGLHLRPGPPVEAGDAAGRLDPWAVLVRKFAALPNVFCKLSGMVTKAGPRWTTAALRPYVEVVLDAFAGPARVMFGSDWPVCLLAHFVRRRRFGRPRADRGAHPRGAGLGLRRNRRSCLWPARPGVRVKGARGAGPASPARCQMLHSACVGDIRAARIAGGRSAGPHDDSGAQAPATPPVDDDGPAVGKA